MLSRAWMCCFILNYTFLEHGQGIQRLLGPVILSFIIIHYRHSYSFLLAGEVQEKILVLDCGDNVWPALQSVTVKMQRMYTICLCLLPHPSTHPAAHIQTHTHTKQSLSRLPCVVWARGWQPQRGRVQLLRDSGLRRVSVRPQRTSTLRKRALEIAFCLLYVKIIYLSFS